MPVSPLDPLNSEVSAVTTWAMISETISKMAAW